MSRPCFQYYVSKLDSLWAMFSRELIFFINLNHTIYSIDDSFILDPPDFEALFVGLNATSIELQSIYPNSGWDFFSISITPNISRNFPRESVLSLPLVISDLIPGSQYRFDVSVEISVHCDFGINHPSSVNVIVCTGMHNGIPKFV